MGLLDILRGKRPAASSAGMAELTNASEAMRHSGLRFAEKAGLCYRASDPCKGSIQEIVRYPRSSGITVSCSATEDSYGCAWILLEGSLEEVVASARAAFDAVAAKNCGQDFLCAAFAYEKEGKNVYWIYNPGGKFYPFIPEGEERDNGLELNLKRELSESLPVEGALSLWYPLWGMPL